MIKVRNNYYGTKSIDIDVDANVTISLRDKQYDELISALEVSTAEKILDSDRFFKKVRKRSEDIMAFIDEIRDFFYEDHGRVFLKRQLKDMNQERLDEILEKHSDLLGFE